MSKKALDQFGRLLMTKVRDEAISDWKMIVHGKMKGEVSEDTRKAVMSLGPRGPEVFLSLVPEIVDRVLHHLLWTLEQSDTMRIAVQAGDESVENLRDVSDGLAGELHGDEGWIARFSKEDK